MVLGPKGQGPGPLPAGLAGVPHFVYESLVAPHQPGAVLAEGDLAGPREGRQVHARGRLVPLGVGKRVGQDEASLGVGVENLDGLAARGRDDVARLEGRPAREVLCGRDEPDDVNRQLERRDRLEGPHYRRPAGHVAFHLLHCLRGLDGEASRVEGHRFSDEHDGCLAGSTALIFQDDEPGRL